MAKPKRKRQRKSPAITPAVPPTDAQLATGEYEQGFVMHAESATKAHTYRRQSSIVNKWIEDGETGFEVPAQRAIADCVTLWERIGSAKVTANYGEHVAASTHGEGYIAHEALAEITRRKHLVPSKYWDVFEAVVRYEEPAGVAGSHFAKNNPQQIASARAIVGLVANVIAMKCGY